LPYWQGLPHQPDINQETINSGNVSHSSQTLIKKL